MSKTVNVPRAEVLRLLGLPADATDEQMNAELNRQLAQIERDLDTKRVSAAERLARQEDRRLVITACNDGRLTADRIEFWCDAMASDRDNNRAVLASLAPGIRPSQPLPVDFEAERAHRAVLRRVGVHEPVREIQAASNELTPYQRGVREHDQRVRDQKRVTYDDLGLPIAPIPASQVVSHGKPKQLWTDQERADALQRQLGQRFWPGTKPPPKSDQVYIPSPNDPYEFDEATGEWRAKTNYQPRS